ncbi:arginine/lysine/ornithine decarboxylase [Desulfosporosinus acidiphilus SJ4]|uniref:Arginine/lysine/ornithine decarboxylase n=1 Tax=Desulfosporosinus acidiphilus (strain DSM 22704 / JCM 16185 / SJ4) TaxID=646529 RepID=I4D021_DESAJ|nr:arginine/lysine/ornithine decarboxylase [Desulfosporosinus acidiphilus]AFM39145.1 arginine/lysine/ornithine decarboxylase [Desulfosporosinus acidiphilus SJ4]
MGELGEGLSQYERQGFCSFHTPGHKGQQEFFNGFDFCGFDLTELPGLDMLHSPKGIIAQAQRRSAEIFGADETFFLVGGGTVGNQAMFLTLADTANRVIIERSSHRSVMSALVLSGLRPDYIRPIIHPEFNLPLGLDIGPGQLSWSDASACHVTYPSYYGTCIELEHLLTDRANLAPDIPVLVDQAHGSHYLGPLFPASAIKLGADLVLHSTHKTLSALTQSAMLHVKGSRVSRSRLRQSLELLQSSSPSYLLLASLERAGEYALDLSRWETMQEEVNKLHQIVGERFRILSQKDAGTYGIDCVDWSKILINTRPLGVTAPRCVKFLREEFGLEPELWDEENILFILGIGNTPEDIRRLTKGLEQLANNAPSLSLGSEGFGSNDGYDGSSSLFLPPQVLTPREAFLGKKRKIPLKESLGYIVGETISPYPPGIPIVVMGEQMTPEVLERLHVGEGRWQGWQGYESQTIWIVEEEKGIS